MHLNFETSTLYISKLCIVLIFSNVTPYSWIKSILSWLRSFVLNKKSRNQIYLFEDHFSWSCLDLTWCVSFEQTRFLFHMEKVVKMVKMLGQQCDKIGLCLHLWMLHLYWIQPIWPVVLGQNSSWIQCTCQKEAWWASEQRLTFPMRLSGAEAVNMASHIHVWNYMRNA